MAKQYITLKQTFNAPAETVFKTLCDHEKFGKLINMNITRTLDSNSEDVNGLGSIRKIVSFPLPAFEETVTTFEPHKLMEYKISKGSPLKNHKGRMEFSEQQSQTLLNYSIEFEPKLPLPFFGAILKKAIQKPIADGLKKLAAQY